MIEPAKLFFGTCGQSYCNSRAAIIAPILMQRQWWSSACPTLLWWSFVC